MSCNEKIAFRVHDTEIPIAESPRSTIYQGEFGTEPVAVKRLKSTKFDLFEREIRQLSKLQHGNLIRYEAVFRNRDRTLDIVMQLGEVETLADALDGYFHMHQWKYLTIGQIASGLRYLHDNGIVHGDLNPRNVLFRDLLHSRVVITNYCASARLDRPPKALDEVLFDAPEPGVTSRSDIFSLTIIICSVLEHFYPRSPAHRSEAILKAMQQPEIGSDPLYSELITSGLSKKPSRRPDAILFENAFSLGYQTQSIRVPYRKTSMDDCFLLVSVLITAVILVFLFVDFDTLKKLRLHQGMAYNLRSSTV